MGIEYYLFALFVFALVLIVLFLVFKARKQKDALSEVDYEAKVQKLMGIYFEAEDMMNSMKEYAAHVNETIDLQLKRLEAEEKRIEALNARFLQGKQTQAAVHETQPEETYAQRDAEAAAPPEKRTIGGWRSEALKLSEMGKTEDEIAEALSVSKGEVRFVLKLHTNT